MIILVFLECKFCGFSFDDELNIEFPDKKGRMKVKCPQCGKINYFTYDDDDDDDCDLFPNGRDYEAEDEDGPFGYD